jgi:hypothetical protein
MEDGLATLEFRHHNLIVRMHGWDILLAMRSRLTVPIGHVLGARAHPAEAKFDDAITDSGSGVGTYIYRRVAAGTVQVEDGRAFYDVHDPSKAIAIELEREPIRRIVVELDDERPDDAVRRIRGALGYK